MKKQNARKIIGNTVWYPGQISQKSLRAFHKNHKVYPRMSTHLHDWQSYMSTVKSPDAFISAGFYSMVAAALQRKVWLGVGDSISESRTFPNLYVFLCGPAGTGKGLVIKQIKKIITSFPLNESADRERVEEEERKQLEAELSASKQLFGTGDNMFRPSKKFRPRRELLIPVAPDDTTYQQLLQIFTGRANRFIMRKPPEKGYHHASLSIILEELSSLFKEDGEKVCKFMLNGYDCGDYDYETKGKGEDCIHNICLNIVAGTTPRYLEDMIKVGLMSDGWSSRIHFIYGHCNRFFRFEPPVFIAEKIEPFLAHLKLLASPATYGPCKFTPDALAYMKHIFEHEDELKKINLNSSPRLIDYYARKDHHARKMAMLVHFADSTDMIITQSECQTAIEQLTSWEKEMHRALTFGTRNPTILSSRSIKEFLGRVGMATYSEIKQSLLEEMPEQEIRAGLNHLIEQRVLDSKGMGNEDKIIFFLRSGVAAMKAVEKKGILVA